MKWAHSIKVGGGVVTPGLWGAPNPLIVNALDDVDFKGKKVLDIGCWDGLWSFMAKIAARPKSTRPTTSASAR